MKKLIKSLIPPLVYNFSRNIYKNRQRIPPQNPPIRSQKEIIYHYVREINRRSSLDVTQINTLSNDFSFEEIESISTSTVETNFYGSWYILQKYLGIPLTNYPPPKIAIQHGLLWELSDWDKKKKNFTNLVWSPLIVQMYQDQVGAEDVYAIGTPFYYSESLFSDEYRENEKKRLGRNLLAFPLHSTHFIDTNWDSSHFISVLKKEQKRFDSVRICLYWKDVQRGLANCFIEKGFECVCCGHMFDPLFLNRQNTLLQICDATISNGIGSHIGNSIIMNKPHWLVPDDFNLVDLEGTEGKDQMNRGMKSLNRKRIMTSFIQNDNYLITPTQKKIVREFWGEKLTRRQLEQLLDNIL